MPEMKVLVVDEECHGVIFVAADLTAVKRELLRTGWVNGGNTCWNKAKQYWDYLVNTYGDNWQESYMGFDIGDLENMGFYIREWTVVRE